MIQPEKHLDKDPDTQPILVTDKPWFNIILPLGWTEVAIRQTTEGQVADIEQLYVQENARGQGIGTRLMKAAFRHCADLGVHHVDTGVISPTTVRIQGRLFGDMLHFIQETDEGDMELPLTAEQASMSIERADRCYDAATEAEQDLMDPGIITRVYLADIDTQGWEAPNP